MQLAMNETLLPALGREASIGSWYDSITNTFLKTSALNSSIIKSERKDINTHELFPFNFSDQHEAFRVLNFDNNGILNLLNTTPSDKLEYYQRFLTEKVDNSSAKWGLVYRSITRQNKLIFDSGTTLDINWENETNATHLVIGKIDGYERYATLKYRDLEPNQIPEANKLLENKLEIVENIISGKGGFFANSGEDSNKNWPLKIKSYGPGIDEKNERPETIVEASELLKTEAKELNSSLLLYILIDVEKLDPNFVAPAKFLESSKWYHHHLRQLRNLNLEKIYLDIHYSEKLLKYIKNMISVMSCCVSDKRRTNILSHSSAFKIFSIKFRKDIRSYLVKFRSEPIVEEPNLIQDIMTTFYNSEFSPEKIDLFHKEQMKCMKDSFTNVKCKDSLIRELANLNKSQEDNENEPIDEPEKRNIYTQNIKSVHGQNNIDCTLNATGGDNSIVVTQAGEVKVEKVTNNYYLQVNVNDEIRNTPTTSNWETSQVNALHSFKNSDQNSTGKISLKMKMD